MRGTRALAAIALGTRPGGRPGRVRGGPLGAGGRRRGRSSVRHRHPDADGEGGQSGVAGGRADQCGRALGSGIVFDGRSDVVTNAHVIDSASSCVVTLSGGDRHRASVVGRDTTHDVAVVHLADATPRPATFADSSKVQVGDLVLAMGNPLGLRSSVTQGIVSSLNRNVAESSDVDLSALIQTSAEINPGNSGGALVDLSGRVIGIPTLTAVDPEFGETQAPGIGFAIPSNSVESIATSLIQSGR